MFRPCMSKIPIWSVGSHLKLRPLLLVPVSLRPHPKNFGHRQSLHKNPIQRSFTCSSDQFSRKHYSWVGSPGHKNICQTNLGKVPGVTRTDKDRLWKVDVVTLTTSAVERLQFLDGGILNGGVAHKAVKDEHFHNVLLEQENYQKYFLTPIEGQYREMISGKKALSSFNEFLTYYYILHEKEPDRRHTLKDHIQFHILFSTLLSELEIHEIWCLTRHFFDIAEKHKTTVLFKEFALAASTNILKRVDALSSEEIFKTADMLFLVGMYRKNLLMKGLVQRMMNQEATEQQVLFFFYLGLEGVSASAVSGKIYDENGLLRLLENLDINEVGIICYGLLKARVRLQHETLGLLLLEKLEGNLDLSPDIAVASIFKFFTSTFDRRLSEKLPNIYKQLTNKHFAEKLACFVSDVKMHIFRQSSVFYILKLYTLIQFSPEVLIDCIVKKLKTSGQMRDMRLKVLSELAGCVIFSTDDTTAQHLFRLIKTEVQTRLTMNKEELINYRRFFVALIYALCERDIYCFKLIKSLFGGRNKPLQPEGQADDIVKGFIYSISESVKIEKPGYCGPLAEKSFADAAPEMAWYQRQVRMIQMVGKYKDPTLRNQFLSATEDALECYFGDRKYFKTQMFIPHFLKYDIGFAVNEMGDVVPASMWITKEGKIKEVEGIRRIAIVLEIDRDAIVTHMDRDGNLSKRPCGRVTMKFRQMKKLGFEVVPIFFEEFQNWENKQELLEQKLSSYVKKSSKKIENVYDVHAVVPNM